MEAMLFSTDFSVTDVDDRKYIQTKEIIYREMLILKSDEKKALLEWSKGPNITNDDQLRFIEAMLSDEVKSLYRASQDLLTRGALKNRNSVLKVIDFYDKVAEVFNDTDVVPETEELPNLHPEFTESKKLNLNEYRMSRETAKEIITTVHPLLATMMSNYELSGNGAGQRSSRNEDYGCVDLSLYVAGYDRASFLFNLFSSFLLYWWQKLDGEGFVQFTLCILNTFQRSNAVNFQLVSNAYTSPFQKRGKTKILKS